MICDLPGEVKLVVGKTVNGRTLLESPQGDTKSVLCRCSCGNEYRITIRHLKYGRTKVCTACASKIFKQTHGAYTGRNRSCERLHRIWKAMKERCSPSNRRDQKTYFGSGIRVCEEWANNYPAFRDWALANGYRDNLTIDRYPNRVGNYEPTNCRWADQQPQQRNRTNNRHIEAFGETKLLTEWCDDPRCVVERSVLGRRITRGWAPERAITEVPKPGNPYFGTKGYNRKKFA